MAGGALPFDHEASEAVRAALRRAGSALIAEAPSDTEVLRASAFLFTNIWLDDLLQRTLNPALPRMCNTDGDELVFTTASYSLKPDASAEAIRLALAPSPRFVRKANPSGTGSTRKNPAARSGELTVRPSSRRSTTGRLCLERWS